MAILNYETPTGKRSYRIIPRFADIMLFYPLIALCALHGEWMLAWNILGHPPRAWIDDPNDVFGGLPHLFTTVILIGILPAAIAGVFLNLTQTFIRATPSSFSRIRSFLFWAVWLIFFFAMSWDPLKIGAWWIR